MISTHEQVLRQDLEAIVGATLPVWESLRGKRLFVTGGTGFFGAWLVRSFAHANRKLALGARMTLLTRNPSGFATQFADLVGDASIELHAGEIHRFEFPPGRFDLGIHAATPASSSLPEGELLSLWETIVDGTRRFYDFAERAGIRRVLLTTSGAVYGRQPSDLSHVPEEFAGAPDPLDPRSVYGEGKRASEMLAALSWKRSGIETAIARCFALSGPFLPLDQKFAIGNFVRDALRGQAIQVGGDGTPYRSYLDARDLAVWLWRLLESAPSCRPYNVGSEDGLSIEHLAELVSQVGEEEGGARVPVRVAQARVPGKSADRYVPCVARARAELGLQATIPLKESIRRMIRWHQSPR